MPQLNLLDSTQQQQTSTSRNNESMPSASVQFCFQPKPEPLDDYYQMPFGQPQPIFGNLTLTFSNAYIVKSKKFFFFVTTFFYFGFFIIKF